MRRGWVSGVALTLGLVFLYAPILSLVIYSFNASRLVTVWDRENSPTFLWYSELLQDQQILSAAWLSLRIGAATATAAVVLGSLAGFVLARFGPFRGRTLLTGLVAAPLVMPEVIMGLALLLLFVSLEQALGWPGGRGALTITLAHVTFAIAFVTIVVQSRLADFDESLEEAARDLGARPATVFFRVTLPLIAPALVAGWLLSFTLSWDDLVIAQFVAGPGASTLPMVVFSRVRLGLTPEVNALATMLMGTVALGVALATMWLRRRGGGVADPSVPTTD